MQTTYRILSLCTASLLVLTSCERKVEVVESDDSYTLDKNVVHVEIPKKFNFNPNNIISFVGAAEVILPISLDGTTASMDNTIIPVKIKLKRALTDDATLIFEEDRELLKSYTGEQLGYHEFPAGTFGATNVTIPKDVTDFESQLNIKDFSKLIEKPGYLTAFRMKIKNSAPDTQVSTINYSLYVKASISPLKVQDNVDVVYNLPSGFTKIPSGNLKLNSNYKADRLGALNDGSTWSGNWWVQGGSDTYLKIEFPKSKVGGIRITRASGNPKAIKNVEVSASLDSGKTAFSQGTIVNSNTSASSFVITFKEPLEINSVVLSKFLGVEEYMDIHEIEVFTIE